MSAGPLPFHPHEPAFHRANALYLAHASDIAYHRAPAAAAAAKLGLRTFPFRSKLTRARGFLGVCDTHAVLAFRGTDPITLPNWLTVAVVRLIEHGDFEGRVHHGFSYALQRTWSKVEAILNEVGDKPLYLTGHSMGGAISVLAANRLQKIGCPPIATYTYGAPRVGDARFCAGHRLPTYRVVNRFDIVPELPLASVKSLLPEQLRAANTPRKAKLLRVVDRLPCYGHVDTLVYIDRDGAVTHPAEVAIWNRETVAEALAARGKPFLDGVKDHLIANYIRSLE